MVLGGPELRETRETREMRDEEGATYSKRRREWDAVFEWHVTEVDKLDERPNLPVGKYGFDIHLQTGYRGAKKMRSSVLLFADPNTCLFPYFPFAFGHGARSLSAVRARQRKGSKSRKKKEREGPAYIAILVGDLPLRATLEDRHGPDKGADAKGGTGMHTAP